MLSDACCDDGAKAIVQNLPAEPNTACCTAVSNFVVSTMATPALHDKRSVIGSSDMTGAVPQRHNVQHDHHFTVGVFWASISKMTSAQKQV